MSSSAASRRALHAAGSGLMVIVVLVACGNTISRSLWAASENGGWIGEEARWWERLGSCVPAQELAIGSVGLLLVVLAMGRPPGWVRVEAVVVAMVGVCVAVGTVIYGPRSAIPVRDWFVTLGLAADVVVLGGFVATMGRGSTWRRGHGRIGPQTSKEGT